MSNELQANTRHLLLCLPDHGLGRLELERLGGSAAQYLRFLNTTGRWAVHGQPHAPLLVWPISHEARALEAASTASVARKRKIVVMERGYSGPTVPGVVELQQYSEQHADALAGPLDYSAARQSKRQAQAEKLAVYIEAVTRVYRSAGTAAPATALLDVERAVNRELHAHYGGGSVQAAVLWLTGKQGKEALQDLLTGQVEPAGDMTIHQIVELMAIADSLVAK